MTTVLAWIAIAAAGLFGGLVGVLIAEVRIHIRRAGERHRELLDLLDRQQRAAKNQRAQRSTR